MTAEVNALQVTFPNGEDEIAGFFATPAGEGPWPGLVVAPENLGLTEHRRSETREMASHGLAVLAVNFYSRIDGLPPQGPFETPDERRRAAFLAMPDEQSAGDLIAAVTWLRAQPNVFDDDIALLGFCSGGATAFFTACTTSEELRCLVSIYGNVVLRGEFTEDRQPRSRIPLTPGLGCPFQGHYGELDFEIPPEHVTQLKEALEEGGKDGEVFTYPDANHVFADPNHPNFDERATRDMWARVYGFLGRHLVHGSSLT